MAGESVSLGERVRIVTRSALFPGLLLAVALCGCPREEGAAPERTRASKRDGRRATLDALDDFDRNTCQHPLGWTSLGR
jgi:hypothetical protein